MLDLDADVLVVGAGFGGSLTALIAQRIGLRVVLIERGSHPRFAIGESSTPLADLALRSIAERYDLPQLTPLTEYGTWRRTHPELSCGLKRGFSYFHHQRHGPFAPQKDHANELLVAANPDAEHGDTHWYRPHFDHFLVRQVQAADIPYFDETSIQSVHDGSPWEVLATRGDQPIRIRAGFLVDASGEGGVLARALEIPNDANTLATDSRAVYAHFEGVGLWEDVYSELGGDIRDHVFPCDAAALHHIFDGGWMWVLRFDHGVTSAGFVLDRKIEADANDLSPQEEWALWLRRFPSIARQFEGSCPAVPLRRTGRLQRIARRMAGANWAMLPHTAYFLDPLFSAGHAHTLTGIERLMAILAETRDAAGRALRLEEYERGLRREIALLDRLIHGAYLGFGPFEWMTAYAMFYFAGATYSEHRRRREPRAKGSGFLAADVDGFTAGVAQAYEQMRAQADRNPGEPMPASAFADEVARAIAPYNRAGLCDPSKRNMYPFV